MIDRLIGFVENGGRFRANQEPKYGEPYYGDYMEQFIKLNYKPGDHVKITTERDTFEGVILVISDYYRLVLLTSGKKVHKDKRNKREILYSDIKTIELVKKDDDSFDLSVVYPDEWERQNRNYDESDSLDEKTENRRNQRFKDQEEFQQVYPNADFTKSHILCVNDGCGLYWPFSHNTITAEIFMVMENNKIFKIPCKTGTPFPNKNSYHAYNIKDKHGNPNLYLYLPDNGLSYKDVNIVCLWTINATLSGKDTLFKVVNIHHVGEVKPILDEHNLIFIDMHIFPLLGHGESLFTKPEKASLLTCMMDRDMYFIFNLKEDSYTMVKTPEDQTESDLDKYLFMASMAINSFNPIEVIQRLATDEEKSFPFVEVFCNIDKEPERYYSSAWRNCRKGFSFSMLPNSSLSEVSDHEKNV